MYAFLLTLVTVTGCVSLDPNDPSYAFRQDKDFTEKELAQTRAEQDAALRFLGDGSWPGYGSTYIEGYGGVGAATVFEDHPPEIVLTEKGTRVTDRGYRYDSTVGGEIDVRGTYRGVPPHERTYYKRKVKEYEEQQRARDRANRR